MSAAAEAIERYWQEHATDATPKKQEFLQAFSERGSVAEGATLAGISRITVYKWRAGDPAFRQAMDSIKEDINDRVRVSLYNQAISEKNVVATIFYLKHNTTEYRDKLPADMATAQREIEARIQEMITGQASGESLASPPSSHSTKSIIAEVIGIPRKPRPE